MPFDKYTNLPLAADSSWNPKTEGCVFISSTMEHTGMSYFLLLHWFYNQLYLQPVLLLYSQLQADGRCASCICNPVSRWACPKQFSHNIKEPPVYHKHEKSRDTCFTPDRKGIKSVLEWKQMMEWWETQWCFIQWRYLGRYKHLKFVLKYRPWVTVVCYVPPLLISLLLPTHALVI